MQKNTGITEEVFVIQDTDDSGFFRTSFLATMSELSGIEKWQHNLNKTNFSFKEKL